MSRKRNLDLHEVVDALAADDRRGALLVALAEVLGVPNLDVIEVAGDDHLSLELGEGAQMCRDGDPALLVGSDLDRAGEIRPRGLALRCAPGPRVLEVGGDPLELLDR